MSGKYEAWGMKHAACGMQQEVQRTAQEMGVEALRLMVRTVYSARTVGGRGRAPGMYTTTGSHGSPDLRCALRTGRLRWCASRSVVIVVIGAHT